MLSTFYSLDLFITIYLILLIPDAHEAESSQGKPMHLFSTILFLGFAQLGRPTCSTQPPSGQCTTLWWPRHGRGGVCALIRSPLIGSVSHQQAVGQYRGKVCRVWCGRTGGNLPVCRQERREEPDSPYCNLLHLQPHLHLGKTP